MCYWLFEGHGDDYDEVLVEMALRRPPHPPNDTSDKHARAYPSGTRQSALLPAPKNVK